MPEFVLWSTNALLNQFAARRPGPYYFEAITQSPLNPLNTDSSSLLGIVAQLTLDLERTVKYYYL